MKKHKNIVRKELPQYQINVWPSKKKENFKEKNKNNPLPKKQQLIKLTKAQTKTWKHLGIFSFTCTFLLLSPSIDWIFNFGPPLPV
jgi:hypothetical protein